MDMWIAIGNKTSRNDGNIITWWAEAVKKNFTLDHRLRLDKTGVTGRIYAWLMLLWMNLCWIVGSRELERQIYEPDRNKQAKLGKAETGMDLGIQKDIPWRIIRENREQ